MAANNHCARGFSTQSIKREGRARSRKCPGKMTRVKRNRTPEGQDGQRGLMRGTNGRVQKVIPRGGVLIPGIGRVLAVV